MCTNAGATPILRTERSTTVTGMLAHAGHWLASLIYVIPVAGLIIYLGVQRRRDRRRGGS